MQLVPRNDWEWSPGKRIGPITLGDRVDNYLYSLRLIAQEHDYDVGETWTRYRSPSWDISILTVNDRITSVRCPSCVFRGKSLIGLSELELVSELGTFNCEAWNHALGRILEFDELGLEAHLDDGIVTAVTVSIDPDTIASDA